MLLRCLGPVDGIITTNDPSLSSGLRETNNYGHIQTQNEQNYVSFAGSALVHFRDLLLYFSNEAILFHFMSPPFEAPSAPIRARVLMEQAASSLLLGRRTTRVLLNNEVECAPSVLIKTHGHSSI